MATIRRLRKEEAKDIEELEQKSFHSPWPLEEIEYELISNPCSIVLGLFDEDGLCGYLDFMITFDSATINRICVLERKRKKGYATLLLKEMERICKGQEEPVEWITLEVRESNVPAQSLYRKMGYMDITVKKMYYEDGENAIYMMRSLL